MKLLNIHKSVPIHIPTLDEPAIYIELDVIGHGLIFGAGCAARPFLTNPRPIIVIGDVELYVDTESGSSATREQFFELQEDIENDEFDSLVIWELSRLAREPSIAEPFFEDCEEYGVDIYITDGMLPGIPSEYGLIRAFASFGVHMARQ